ncbi:AraC family transcriptional regulator [uncultured Tenacibaculum sp.]|uniref:helix-turn-helix domain-containing protein n=1 Tax=uncultured Tenacibaculum sp. TaxID=174713 RepID=UPI0026367B59|nr:AraC family transcriptional regulator [uncultured Tenacibaculum sp.]
MYNVCKPKSEILKKYISEFTLLKKENFKPINYLAFPHNNSAIVFLSKATVSYNDYKITVSQNPNNVQSVVALGKYLHPLHLFYSDAVDEICINFTPTGLNYFFKQNFKQIAGKPIQFVNNEIWTNFSKQLFNYPKQERIELLEKFLLSQLQEKDLSIIEQLTNILTNDLTIKVKDLALKTNLSPRTINRLFHTYLGRSPSAFKKIQRFRNAIEMKNNHNSLTEISLLNEYYDSAHFNHEFQELTNTNPTSFFNQVSKVGDEKFSYIFM